jgi:hypothetical protein
MLFLISLLIFLIVILVKRLTNPKEKFSNNSVVVSNNNHKVDTSAILDSKITYGTLLQFLESITIVQETASLDTLAGRLEFVNTIYPSIVVLSKSTRFNLDVQKAIDEYKTQYYDKILMDIQINLLVNPNEIELKKHFADCVCKCYNRYVERQKTEIQKLIRESAIEKRKDDLIKKGYSAKYMFKTYDLPENGHHDVIEDLRKQFYSYQKK